jgi:hypothetical protein
MKSVNAGKVDRKSGVRFGERGAPVHYLWHLFRTNGSPMRMRPRLGSSRPGEARAAGR